MPTYQVYLNDEQAAKLVYIQEEVNKGKPFAEQKKASQILNEWIITRIDAHELARDIKALTEG